jgi:tetratricopeptide (TPR) repeat protein
MVDAGYSFDDWSDAEQRAEMAHEMYEHGRWPDALREIDAALQINPHQSDWFFNKGLTLDTLSRYHEAIETYKQVHELQPDDTEALNCLAIDYTRVGEYDLALETFEKIEKIDPDFEPAYCNRIITYAELGRHEKAEEMFYLARQLKEHCPICYYNMGNSLFSRKLYDRAIWCWQQTRNLDPQHPHINYRIAQACWAKGDTAQAREHFFTELRLNPGDLDVLLDAGILLLEMNDLDSAREKFHRLIEIDSQQSQAHHYLGELYLHEQKIPQALECFNRALSLDPQLHGSNYRLGECHLLLGQLANAREHLLAELALSPDQSDVLIDLGCLLQDVGQTTEAMYCFERALDVAPQDPRPFQNLSLCYYLTGLTEQGIDLSLKVLELDPTHVPALHNLAYAHLQERNFSAADEYIFRACRLAPEDRRLKKLQRTIAISGFLYTLAQPFTRLFSLIKKSSQS